MSQEELIIRVSAEKLERAAYVLKCVAHPVRISIIDLLDQRKELNVGEMQEVLGIEPSLLSHHLQNMRDKGVLLHRRAGKYIYYQLSDDTITNIIKCIQDCERF